MITARQLINSYQRKEKKRKNPVKRLKGCPQRRGTVTKLFEASPKKPNSAKRRCAKVRLSTGKSVQCHLPGIGHNLMLHSVVLVRGGRCQDLVGVRYKPIRGIFDFQPVRGRITRKSKYGIKGKPNKNKEKDKINK